MGKRGQIAVEYVIIMGIAFLLTIPLLIIFYQSSSQATEQVQVTQTDQLVRKLTENVNAVHTLGEPSFTTLRAYVPNDVEDISIGSREIVFTLVQGGNTIEIVGVTTVNITGGIPAVSGIHKIRVQAIGDEVLIIDT